MSGRGVRPGFGERHPDLIALLARHTPVVTTNDVWANGTLPLRVSAYVGVPPIAELVSSIRCVVRVDGKFVVCRVPGELHALPGGRPEPGETPPQTAVREVYEETGWHLDPESLHPLGFLHLQRLVGAPPGHPYPHPDFLQLIYSGVARTRAVDTGEDWADLDGWELGTFLADAGEIVTLDLSPISLAFVNAALRVER
ncbi:NUDIX domain-containing protein [Actinopolymorpha sp. NPDC004070]|uniref:NUDIX domain-containing protein n=1 Tax=Actinopolymorpha sp. NPDC004070 TaxID=3154548 RepID=UPI0033A2D965